jgi:hypothetical protein
MGSCSLNDPVCHGTETAIGQSPLLGLCYSSITIAATSVILLLATILLTLFSSVHIWKVFFFMSCQYGSIVLKGRSVHGLATMLCCEIEIYFEEAAFFMQYV